MVSSSRRWRTKQYASYDAICKRGVDGIFAVTSRRIALGPQVLDAPTSTDPSEWTDVSGHIEAALARPMLGRVLPPTGTKPVHPERVRDLLGLVRLLFALATAQGDAEQQEAVKRAGQLLRVAFDQSRCRPGTLGQRAAPMNLAAGLEALGRVAWPPDVEKLIDAARERLR